MRSTEAVLRSIHRIIYGCCEEQMPQTQFRLRNARRTIEAIFCIQVVFQPCKTVNSDISVFYYFFFINYQKAFDKVLRLDILKRPGIDDKNLRIIIKLYWN